jgi:hypothetical protein
MSKKLSKRAPSFLWNHFTKNEGDSKCNHCAAIIKKSGNTSNMGNHLNRAHVSILKSAPKVANSIKQFLIPKQKKEQLDIEFAVFCATESQPLCAGEKQGYIRLLSKHSPGYKPPCSSTLKKKFLLPIHEKVRKRIASLLKDQSFSLAVDLWTNCKQEGFLGITCNFMRDSGVESVALDCVPFDCEHNINIRNNVIFCLFILLFG